MTTQYMYKNEVDAVTDCFNEAMVTVLLSVQHAIFDEDGDGSQDEGHKQIHVNEVSGAVELPGEKTEVSHLVLLSHSEVTLIH